MGLRTIANVPLRKHEFKHGQRELIDRLNGRERFGSEVGVREGKKERRRCTMGSETIKKARSMRGLA